MIDRTARANNMSDDFHHTVTSQQWSRSSVRTIRSNRREMWHKLAIRNIDKGTTDPTRVEFISQFTVHKSWTNYNFRISIKQLQNLNQTSASPLNLKFKILTKPRASEPRPRLNFITSTKSQPKNKIIYSFNILPELQLQNLDQNLCSKSEQKLSFITKPQLRNL